MNDMNTENKEIDITINGETLTVYEADLLFEMTANALNWMAFSRVDMNPENQESRWNMLVNLHKRMGEALGITMCPECEV